MTDIKAPETPKKPHISASQVNTYTECGERYRRRYIEKHIIPPGIAMVRGIAIHRGAEFNFAQKIESKKDLPREDIVARAVAEYEGHIKREGLYLSTDDEARGKAIVQGEALDCTARLAGLFADEVAPVYQPRTAEETIRIALENAPRDILGILDMTAYLLKTPDGRPAEEDAVGIVDYKSSKKTKSQTEFDNSINLTIYALTFLAKYGKPPAFINVEQLVDLKKPKRVLNVTARSMTDFNVAVARINAVLDGIEKRVFTPAPTGWWGCCEKWCGYWSTCGYVNNERKEAAKGQEV